MNKYFNLFLEFDKQKVLSSIANCVLQKQKGYVCVVDGNVLTYATKHHEYREIVNGGMVNICDGSSIALMAGRIHKQKFAHYTGSDIFKDLRTKGYRQCFLGNTKEKLAALKCKLESDGIDTGNCMFEPLPFMQVENFDYQGIASKIDAFGADIIWVSLGAPKQEIFISRIIPFVNRGVLFAVGAAINFYVGNSSVKRAPEWMLKRKLEWVYRVYKESRKQCRRVWGTLKIYPALYMKEKRMLVVKKTKAEMYIDKNKHYGIE